MSTSPLLRRDDSGRTHRLRPPDRTAPARDGGDQRELEERGDVEQMGAPSIDWIGVPLSDRRPGDRCPSRTELLARSKAGGAREGHLAVRLDPNRHGDQRSRAEAEIRASAGQLKAIIDTSLDAVITMDGTGAIRSWSPQAERVFGWAAPRPSAESCRPPSCHRATGEAHERGSRTSWPPAKDRCSIDASS